MDTPRKRKGLLAFYIGTGALIALILVLAFAWKPVAIHYYEWQVGRKTRAATQPSQIAELPKFQRLRGLVSLLGCVAKDEDLPSLAPPAWKDAKKLADFGRAAQPAFDRLLRSENEAVRDLATVVLVNTRATWALPMIMGLTQDNDQAVSIQALMTAQLLVGEEAAPSTDGVESDPLSFEAQERLLEWWEREGKTKYGRPGE